MKDDHINKECAIIRAETTRYRVYQLLKQGETNIRNLWKAYNQAHKPVSYVSILKALTPLILYGYVRRTKGSPTNAKASMVSISTNVIEQGLLQTYVDALAKIATNLKKNGKLDAGMIAFIWSLTPSDKDIDGVVLYLG